MPEDADNGWCKSKVLVLSGAEESPDRRMRLAYVSPFAPGLSVTRALGSHKDEWTVTVACGWNIPRYGSREQMQALAVAMAPLTDWSKPVEEIMVHREKLSRALNDAWKEIGGAVK